MPNISDSRQKEKFLVGLTLEEKELLNLYAKDKFVSMSEILRLALYEYAKNNDITNTYAKSYRDTLLFNISSSKHGEKSTIDKLYEQWG